MQFEFHVWGLEFSGAPFQKCLIIVCDWYIPVRDVHETLSLETEKVQN